MFEKINKMLEGMLDTAYLFNEDHKQIRVNVKLLMILLIAVDVVDGIVSLMAHGPANVWFGVIGSLGLGVAAFWITSKMRPPGRALPIIGLYILLNIWIQFIFYGPHINYLLFLIYPIVVCFFLSNSFGIKFIPILFINLLICTLSFRSSIHLFSNDNPYIYLQFIVSFICACVFAFSIEHIHSRIFKRLTSLTNQITDDSFADPLTRLLTRRAFNERFAVQLEEHAAAGKQPLFIIMCDIDHFKSVNDNYGHQVGDDVLKHVSGILSKYAVGKDLCFRWGGEEFLIFLHEKSLQKAIDATNRIRVVLEYTPFLSNISGVIKVTMSFGLHQYDNTMSMDKNISVADGYLYAAKHNGRNRVEHA